MPRPQDFTVGVEEEYQLLDARTGDLRSRARYVIAGDWADALKAEMQEHTVEVETGVCEATTCIRDDLARLRFTAAVAAEAQGLRIAAAGTHPRSPAEGHEFNPAPVYQELREEYRRLAESQAIFGMHVHVGVPRGTDRARVANLVRLHLAVLLALTASSPYFEGHDTGHASYRSILWRRWPRTGAPPRFRDDAEYAALVRWLVQSGRIDGPGRLYWDLRPHHVYPTVEIRIADCTPRLDDAVAVAALARCIVAGAGGGDPGRHAASRRPGADAAERQRLARQPLRRPGAAGGPGIRRAAHHHGGGRGAAAGGAARGRRGGAGGDGVAGAPAPCCWRAGARRTPSGSGRRRWRGTWGAWRSGWPTRRW